MATRKKYPACRWISSNVAKVLEEVAKDAVCFVFFHKASSMYTSTSFENKSLLDLFGLKFRYLPDEK